MQDGSGRELEMREMEDSGMSVLVSYYEAICSLFVLIGCRVTKRRNSRSGRLLIYDLEFWLVVLIWSASLSGSSSEPSSLNFGGDWS